MNERRWYIIQTYSGYENSVKVDLEKRIETMGQQDYIFNVLVPEEEYIEEKKDGSKVVKTRKSYPSYVFVEMIVTEKSWFIVRNTPKVTGFLGSSGGGTKPVPVPVDEMNRILVSLGMATRPKDEFNVGDKIEVIDGPFASRVANIAAINEETEEVIVLVEMFGGRSTQMTFGFKQIRKI